MMARVQSWSRMTYLGCFTLVVLGVLWQYRAAEITNTVRAILARAHRCESPPYTVRIISHDPVMMHIEDFITPYERRHLLSTSSPNLARSMVAAKNGTEMFSSERSSRTAYIPKDDPVAKCIYDRVSAFQGYEPLENIESLQVTAYQQDQQYRDHFDWFGPKANVTKDRITTFFGVLEADCDNCGTNFPDLPVSWDGQDERWCRFVDCTASSVTVLPVPGSALFWKNLHSDGTGDRRMRHAGLPLTRGTKTGLNIWTTQEMV